MPIQSVQSIQFVIIGLALVGIVGAMILKSILAAKREKALADWAAAHGLQFHDERHFDTSVDFPTLDCLAEGDDDRYSYNHTRGPWGKYQYLGFDYHYATYTTDDKGNRQKHDHYFSVVVIESELSLKLLTIRPEGLFDKVKSAFGKTDINFESTEFSKKFYVQADDKKWAYDVIHPRTMQLLLDAPRFHLQFCGRTMFAWTGSTFDVPLFEAAAKVLSGVLDGLPDFVVKELQESPAAAAGVGEYYRAR